MNKKAIVVLSGGQDSALCLALACRRFGAENVAAITFAYGQRHSVELRFAKKLARHFAIAAHKVVKLDFYKSLTDSALFDSKRTTASSLQTAKLQTTNYKLQTSNFRLPPPTVVEGRNAIFLQIAAVWAKSLGAEYLYTGVSQTDYSGYPDCRSVFIRAQQRALRLALEYPIKIVTPFMYKTKAEEWALADRLGILDFIRKHTVTCYNGIPGDGCGKCDSCRLRNAGLQAYLSTDN